MQRKSIQILIPANYEVIAKVFTVNGILKLINIINVCGGVIEIPLLHATLINFSSQY